MVNYGYYIELWHLMVNYGYGKTMVGYHNFSWLPFVIYLNLPTIIPQKTLVSYYCVFELWLPKDFFPNGYRPRPLVSALNVVTHSEALTTTDYKQSFPAVYVMSLMKTASSQFGENCEQSICRKLRAVNPSGIC